MAKRASRKLAVILHADVVNSTALVRRGEVEAHERIQDRFRLLARTIESYGGTTHELRGDAVVAEFARASDAVSTALAFQAENHRHNAALDEMPVRLRIGIGLGEVVIADHTVTGAGVVLAQRLEQLAEPGGVSLQGAIYEAVPRWLPFAYEHLGDRDIKGFDERVRVYKVTLKPGETIPAADPIAVDTPQPSLPDRPAVAVLPFVNLSGDAEQEHFSDGITEDIITSLSRFREIFVVARNSSYAFKGRSVDVAEVGKTLGVHYVVDGSVRRSGNRVRITVQLIDAILGDSVWGNRYDRDLGDIFAVQDEVCETVVATLAGRLVEVGAERARRRRPEHLTAHDLLMSGRAHLHRYSRDAVAEARRLFQDALALEPDYATAHAMVAHTHWIDWWAGWTLPERSLRLFHEAAERAMLLDDSDASAQGEQGFCYLFLRRYDAAKHHMDKALVLNPNGTDNLIYLSWHALFTGRGELAFEHLDRAQRLDPFGRYGFIRGLVHYSLRQYADAAAALQTVRLRIPAVHAWLAASLARSGQAIEARREAAKFIETMDAELKNAGAAPPASWREWFTERLPYERDADLQHVLEGLRAARLE
ncbi:MAG TPA: adenylate/guanylate cyclase domain-containing protein [Gammaproteobacteria bacterium]|nr:adenylate/guanylate cyclase domain-containing protein [Gammaproteobacteria bacterium]